MKTCFIRKNLFSFLFISLLTVAASFGATLGSQKAFADGMLIRPDPYGDRWDFQNEDSQEAFITYKDGLQKMILSIDLGESTTSEAVWLFPVPANPDNVSIDILKSLPNLKGEEISIKAKSNLNDIKYLLANSQIYPSFFGAYLGTNMGMKITGDLALSNAGGLDFNQEDVLVYAHIEKEGITSEIITAKTSTGLYNYLKSKNLNIEAGSIPVLDHYIGKDYSFIVSWISPAKGLTREEIRSKLLSNNSEDMEAFLYYEVYADFQNLLYKIENEFMSHELFDCLGITNSKKTCWGRYFGDNPEAFEKLIEEIYNNPSLITAKAENTQRGIYVTFKTDKIYFPMLPTSVYGSTRVPATIRVAGHVSPKIFKDISTYTKVEYFINGYDYNDELPEDFYGGSTENVKYTRISIDAPSKFLTDDLWIENKVPSKILLSRFIAKNVFVTGLALLIGISFVTGILVGFVVFKEMRTKPLRLGLLGLSNCLSIIGLAITTSLVGTKKISDEMVPVIEELKSKGYIWKRKLSNVLIIINIPFLYMFIPRILSLFLMARNLIMPTEMMISRYNFPYLLGAMLTGIVSILLLVISFRIRKIKPEDKHLFDKLKENKYSLRSFHPWDSTKITFVVAFSVTFLVISRIIIELLVISV